MKNPDGGRIGIASRHWDCCRAYELAPPDTHKNREAFGKPIVQHQAIAFKLANMATEIDAARLFWLPGRTTKKIKAWITVWQPAWAKAAMWLCAIPSRPYKFMVDTTVM